MPSFDGAHIVIHLAIEAPDAKTLPVLVELDERGLPTMSLSVAMYARYLQREGARSYETLRKYVTAIGKLKDYYTLVCASKPIEAREIGRLLEDFLHAYDHGTVLGWAPSSQNEYVLCRSAVVEYVKFVMDNGDAIWPIREMRFIEDCRVSWSGSQHAEKSLLFHTKKRLRKKTGGRKKALTGLRQYKPFPQKYLQLLLDETKNPRDRLLFSTLAFGGRRISEVLNAFTHDVFTDKEMLRFVLAHPVQSLMEWTNLSGATLRGTRKEYLKKQFGLLPRTDHGAERSALGWKGIKFDDEAALKSETYFIRNADKELIHLYREYLHEVRQRLPRRPHPYYWVNEDGEPLTLKAAAKQFDLARKRVEKKFGVSLKGYGLHSLRHYYGFYCVDVLKADLLMVQKWMGHAQISSTAVYAHISPETARDELAAAEGRKAIGAQAQGVLPSTLQRHGTTALGNIDTKRLTRKMR
uniref:tyrosine-type recombinase/integrase n=1 Tax=Hylemonella sp. TaxID=2066020 RepID=UPI0035B0285C